MKVSAIIVSAMLKSGIKKDRKKLTQGLILLGIASSIVYMATLCPTIYVGDSGELIAASWTMGVPHSPGYPLYTLIGYFFAHAPIGDNPAVRMNFMTALFSIGSILVLYRLIVLITGEHVVSFFTSLVFATGLVNWSQSVTSEVYTLNNLVVCLALLYIILASIHQRNTYLYVGAFLSGLALTTHQTSLLILPAAIWLMISRKMLPLTGKAYAWGYTLLFYILGFAFYIYLPIAASQNPAMNWGDPSTFDNFMQAVFSPVARQANNGNSFSHLIHFLSIFSRELTLTAAILSVVGIVFILNRQLLFVGVVLSAIGIINEGSYVITLFGILLFVVVIVVKPSQGTMKYLRFLAWVFLSYIIFFLATLKPGFQSLSKLDVYYLPVYMIGAVFTAVGVRFLFDYIQKEKPHISRQLLISLSTLVMALCVVWNLASNWETNDKSDNYLAEWYGKNLLESCDENSILMCNFDDLFILFYAQHVLGVRDDVTTVLAHFPKQGEKAFWAMWLYEQLFRDKTIDWTETRRMFFKSSGTEEIIENFIDRNIDTRPVFFTFYRIPPLELMEVDFRFEPERFCYRIKKFNQDYDVIEKNFEWFVDNYEPDYFNKMFQRHHNIEEDFILVRLDEIFKFNYVLLQEVEDYERAYYFIQLASSVNPLDTTNWWLRSRIEEKLGLYDNAVESLEQIIELEFQIENRITERILDMRYEQARLYHLAGEDLPAAEILNQFFHMDERKLPEIRELAKDIERALND